MHNTCKMYFSYSETRNTKIAMEILYKNDRKFIAIAHFIELRPFYYTPKYTLVTKKKLYIIQEHRMN